MLLLHIHTQNMFFIDSIFNKKKMNRPYSLNPLCLKFISNLVKYFEKSELEFSKFYYMGQHT